MSVGIHHMALFLIEAHGLLLRMVYKKDRADEELEAIKELYQNYREKRGEKEAIKRVVWNMIYHIPDTVFHSLYDWMTRSKNRLDDSE